MEAEERRDDQQGDEGEDEEEYKLLADNYKEEGNSAFKSGNFTQAVEMYTRALDMDPDNHLALSNRSAAFLKINERGKALKDAERLMELKPDWPKSFSRKAAAQYALTRYESAVETYSEGLRYFPDESALKEGLKAAEEGLEREKKARYERAKVEREARDRELQGADKRLEEAKAKAAAKARAAAAKGHDEAAAATAAQEKDDDLAGFFSEIGAGGAGAGGAEDKAKQQKLVSEAYAKADLGTAEEQVARLLQPNHQWKNLNPLEVLQLDVDATEDDVKLRYRKLSALVHPDKCQHLDNAREAFEEVKKAYNQMMEEERRAVVVATIEATRKRALKDRRQKLKAGMTVAQLGSEEEALRKAVMKEFAEIELRRRNSEQHAQAYKQYEQQMEDEANEKMRKDMAFEKSWGAEDKREGRIGSWRDFQRGPGAKRARVQSWTTEENVKDKSKFGQHKKEEWRKSWK